MKAIHHHIHATFFNGHANIRMQTYKEERCFDAGMVDAVLSDKL